MAKRGVGYSSNDSKQFWETTFNNKMYYIHHYRHLVELAISSFEYKNLPETIDPRYLELGLLAEGVMAYFNDDVIGDIVTRVVLSGPLNIYDIPERYHAIASNGYTRDLDQSDSVLIFNNYLHTPSAIALAMYANQLSEIDRIIDVNIHAQKTPVLVQASEKERLTMLNLYKKYEANEPFIFGSKNLDPNGIKVLKTDAPFLADKLYQLRTDKWNEAMTYLGIANVSVNKKERLITDEVNRAQGGTVASKNSRLEARRDAVEKINAMFGTNIEVSFRQDLDTTLPNEPYTTDNDFSEGGTEDNG